MTKIINLVLVCILAALLGLQTCTTHKVKKRLDECTKSTITSLKEKDLLIEDLNRIQSSLLDSLEYLQAVNQIVESKLLSVKSVKANPQIKYVTRTQLDTELTQRLATTVNELYASNDSLLNELMVSKAIADGYKYAYPVYSSSFQDAFLDLTIKAAADTTQFELIHNDNVIISVEKQRKNLFKPDKYSIFALSTSPYSTVKKTEAIEFKPKPKRFGLGFNLSYSVNPQFEFYPTLGVGFQYTPIRF